MRRFKDAKPKSFNQWEEKVVGTGADVTVVFSAHNPVCGFVREYNFVKPGNGRDAGEQEDEQPK